MGQVYSFGILMFMMNSAEPHLEIRPNYSVRPNLISIIWTESGFGRAKPAKYKTERFGQTITSVPNLFRTFPYLIFSRPKINFWRNFKIFVRIIETFLLQSNQISGFGRISFWPFRQGFGFG